MKKKKKKQNEKDKLKAYLHGTTLTHATSLRQAKGDTVKCN